jgi:hypothetical protein
MVHEGGLGTTKAWMKSTRKVFKCRSCGMALGMRLSQGQQGNTLSCVSIEIRVDVRQSGSQATIACTSKVCVPIFTIVVL